jgi:hypothetical protein
LNLGVIGIVVDLDLLVADDHPPPVAALVIIPHGKTSVGTAIEIMIAIAEGTEIVLEALNTGRLLDLSTQFGI